MLPDRWAAQAYPLYRKRANRKIQQDIPPMAFMILPAYIPDG